MGRWIERMLALVAAVLGLVAMPDAASLGLAIALVAVAVLAAAITLGALPATRSGSPHPLRAIAVGAIPAQSDPDAAGHPRPRAPGAPIAA